MVTLDRDGARIADGVIRLDDDLPEPARVRVQNYELVIDAAKYSVNIELAIMHLKHREVELLKDKKSGGLEAARDLVADLAAAIVLPSNRDWTRELLVERLSINALVRLIYFYGIWASTPARRDGPTPVPAI